MATGKDGDASSSPSSSCWKMGRRPALLYGSVFVWISITGGRFIAPFLEQDGHLTVTEIGCALALQQVVSTVVSSTGGSYADSMEFKYPKRGRAICMGIGTVLGTLAYLLHSIPTYLSLHKNENEIEPEQESIEGSPITNVLTLYHIILRCVYATATCFIFPVLDGMTVGYLEQSDESNGKSDYGRERVYGAYTWAISNLCMAPLLDSFGFWITYYGAIFACILVLWTIFVFVTSNEQHHRHEQRQLMKRKSEINTDDVNDASVEHQSIDIHVLEVSKEQKANLDYVATEETKGEKKKDEEGDDGDEKERLSLFTLLKLLLGNSFAVAFMFAILCLSQGQAVVDSLIFLFFELLGSSYMLMGWTVVFTVAFEIPIFHVAPQLLEKWGSTKLILVGCFAYIVRVLGYTLIPTGHAAYLLLLEPLHGVTYACGQTASVDFVANLMPEGYEASGQGLIYLFKGAGSILGLLLGGWTEDTIGPRFMYRVSASIVTIGSLVLCIACWSQSSTRRGRLQQGHRHRAIPQIEEEIVEIELSSTPA